MSWAAGTNGDVQEQGGGYFLAVWRACSDSSRE